MSGVIRVVKSKSSGFFIASNEPFNDSRLRWEARGILGYLLSKPDEWICRNQDLVNQGPAGGKKVDGILQELKKYGYMSRKKYQKNDGTFEWETNIYESPDLNPDFNPASIPLFGGYGERPSIPPKSIDGKGGDIVNTEIINTEINKEDKELILFQHFLEISQKRGPQGDIARDEWFADCDDILKMAGNDVEYAKELITQARLDCIEAGYSYAKPGGLINWITGILEKKEVKAKKESKTWHDGYQFAEVEIPESPLVPADLELQQIRAIAGAQFTFLNRVTQRPRDNGLVVLEFTSPADYEMAQHRKPQIEKSIEGLMKEDGFKIDFVLID